MDQVWFTGRFRPTDWPVSRSSRATIGNRPEHQAVKKPQATYPLRSPLSIKVEVEHRAKADGISIDQFVATAVAEKLAAMNTAAFFNERREKVDFAAFDRIMERTVGEPPRQDDRLG